MPSKSKPSSVRIALYTYGPNADARHAMLDALATAHGWRLIDSRHDPSGSRSELKALQAAIADIKPNVIMVHDLAELGDGVLDVIETAAWFEAQGVHLYCINPPMDGGPDDGEKLAGLIRYLADYGASMPRARQRSGAPKKPRGKARKPPPK